ncbi:MAG: sodium:solute symporter family protein [Candidatus Methanoplasma sp.]|jgi:SSS family solute:Na+ symporter|nr:sodium:solute symporter family protein [Candidatus Methanoplasma sp.]
MMASEGVPFSMFLVMMAVFVASMILLGWYGYRHTKDNQQFLLGRNKANALLIALSYGATFLSASAIIGFGGQAATHGLGLMWLCFLNLALGLFVPFVLFAPRVRKIGRALGASTFADLLGKIFKSNWIRGFIAGLIIIMMPIYGAAVMKGGVNTLVVLTGTMDLYNIILIILAIVVGLYVVYGGIIAVMYNDVLQASVMAIGMVVILAVTLYTLGGFTAAFNSLSDLTASAGTLPGFNGFTGYPSFGTPEWWTLTSTFLLGVGIGAMTQPQLVVRFMSAKDDKMLNRSLIVGSIFMFIVVGCAYTVGSMTNVYFFNEYGQTAFPYVTGTLGQGVDFIIPNYVLDVFSGVSLGEVFICVFILSLLCAAISTISALLHTIGVAGGHDIYSIFRSRKSKEQKMEDFQSLKVNRIVTAIVMVLVVVYCYLMPNDIIAKATSLFMGMTAAALLPLMVYGLYSKAPKTKVAAASMGVGTATYLFWALFINAGSSIFLPICKWLTGNKVLFMDSNIMYVDALIVALPLSALTLLIAFAWMRWVTPKISKAGSEKKGTTKQ